MSSFRKPTSSYPGDDEVYGSEDLNIIVDALNGTVSDIPPIKFKSSSGVTFWDSVLKFRNQADTFTLTLRNPDGLTQDRELSLPAVTSNDVLLALNFAQTPTNKTIVLANNTVTDTSAGSGDVIVHNGTKFVRLPAGTTSQFLRGDGTWQLPPGAGGGEANTGSNVGTATGKVYKQNSGTVLQFKSIGGGSSKISTTNGTDDVTLDVAEGNLTLDNLGGTLGVAKGGTGATTFTAGVLKASGTSAFTTVAAPASAIVGLTDAQILTTKTINATNNTITDTDTAVGDLLKSNGAKFVRLTRGSAGQVLKVNSGGDDIEWAAESGGGGGGGLDADKVKVYEGGTQVGSVARKLNFNATHFNVTEDPGNDELDVALAAVGGGDGGLPLDGELVEGKWGKLGHNNGLGILAGALQLNQASTPTITGYRTSTEHGISILATSSNMGGGYVSQIANLYRELGFTLTVRWQLIQGGSNSTNLWIGVTDRLGEDFTVSGFPDGENCLLFGKVDNDTTFRTIRNNGAGSSTTSDTKTQNENVNTVVITGSTDNMTVKFNSDSTSTYTTSIPSTTTPLGIIVWMNAESSSNKTFRILDIDLSYTWKTGGAI